MSTIANQNQPTGGLAPTAPLSIAELHERRKQLTALQLELERTGCPYDPSLSEGENARRQFEHGETIRKLIHEQLSIMAAMRGTAAGPAKAGGKRAKKAPIDTAALDAAIFE